MSFSKNMPWVIVRLRDQQFAISTNYVKEMVRLPNVVSVPKTPSYIRGVINLRGKVFPVLDLRVKLGMESLPSEIYGVTQLLEKREEDHKNWLDELEASVNENRAFKLTTDPHQCAFGKWYDGFNTDNRMLARCLKKFDEPHQKIHTIAIYAKEFVEKGSPDEARDLILNTKNHELSELLSLFAEARRLMVEECREIALCLEVNHRIMAVTVDFIETVERLQETEIDALPESMCTMNNDYLSGIGKKKNGVDLVQLLEMEKILFNDDALSYQ